MSVTSPLTPAARWGIIVAGLLTGVLWAVFGLQLQQSPTTLYLQVLTFGVSSVLAFTVTRWRNTMPWLLTLAVLPFLAGLTGWQIWNFSVTQAGSPRIKIILQVSVWLFLLLPFLQARRDKHQRYNSAEIVEALWHNGFIVAASSVLTGVFWLVLLFWSRLFELIGIGFFEALFFDNSLFPTIASATVLSASIVLCRNAPKGSATFRRVVTLLAAIVLPPLAAISLLFIAFLPFTGLAIIPKSISATSVLLTLALAIMVMSAMLNSATASAPRYPDWLRRLVVVAQWLTPLFALLATNALWLRVAQYGWTVDRVNAAVIIAVTLLWTLGAAWLQRRAWHHAAIPRINTLTATLLGLMALLWLLVHSPVIDPYRITVTSQLARFASGAQKANAGDIWAFSSAGRRGQDALQALKANPQWLEKPAEQRRMVVSRLQSSRQRERPQTDEATLREKIKLRKDSPPLPESWWQTLLNKSFMAYSCVDDSSFCMAWVQDLNNDGVPEVLIYSRDLNNITAYAEKHGEWREQGKMSFKASDTIIEQKVQQGQLSTVTKPWRDLVIDGQRYPMRYYDFDGD